MDRSSMLPVSAKTGRSPAAHHSPLARLSQSCKNVTRSYPPDPARRRTPPKTATKPQVVAPKQQKSEKKRRNTTKTHGISCTPRSYHQRQFSKKVQNHAQSPTNFEPTAGSPLRTIANPGLTSGNKPQNLENQAEKPICPLHFL